VRVKRRGRCGYMCECRRNTHLCERGCRMAPVPHNLHSELCPRQETAWNSKCVPVLQNTLHAKHAVPVEGNRSGSGSGSRGGGGGVRGGGSGRRDSESEWWGNCRVMSASFPRKTSTVSRALISWEAPPLCPPVEHTYSRNDHKHLPHPYTSRRTGFRHTTLHTYSCV
jgi:hypothetical protein